MCQRPPGGAFACCIDDYCVSSGRGRCLDNEPPRVHRFLMPAALPGQFHDSLAQCRFQFGPLSVRCNKTTVRLVQYKM